MTERKILPENLKAAAERLYALSAAAFGISEDTFCLSDQKLTYSAGST